MPTSGTVFLKTLFLLVIAVFSLNFIQIEKEAFAAFIKEFDQNSKFQMSRISFPLKVAHTEIGETKERFYLVSKKEWKHEKMLDNKDRKVITKILKNADGSMGVQKAIYDTGVQVVYIFRMTKGKWYLVKIIDEST